MSFQSTAEAVSLGHPDKCADYISSYVLDRYLSYDPFTRYAVEVLIKGNTVVLGGEVKSTKHFDDKQIKEFVISALSEIGYSKSYGDLWKDNAIEVDKINVINLIGEQSEDISMGVSSPNRQCNKEVTGWGDQGVFVGYASRSDKFLSLAHMRAKRLCSVLYELALYRYSPESKFFRHNTEEYKKFYALPDAPVLGLDIKTQITLDENGKTNTVIAAVPVLSGSEEHLVSFIKAQIGEQGAKYVINGTGKYTTHSSVADCGITGRKLACDFYSVTSPIGGGSVWTKDASKADVSLNLYARKLAIDHLENNDECFVYLSSCIGKEELPSSVIKTIKDGCVKYSNFTFDKTAEEVIEQLSLRCAKYALMCRNSLYGFML